MRRFMAPAILCVCLSGCFDGPPPLPPDPIDALFNHGLEKIVMNIWDGSDWSFGAKTLYTYAPGKRLTKQEGGPSPEADWKPVFGHDYSYDAGGRLETDTQFSYVAGVREDDLQWRYVYDAGRLAWMGCFYASGPIWWPSFERDYVDDAFGRLQSRTEYDATVTPRYPTYQFVYVYDADDRVETRTDYAWSGASWVPSHREMFTYDLDGRIEEYTDGGWNGATFAPYGQYTYAYDALGRLEVMTNAIWSGGVWEATERRTYTYDAEGRIQSRLRENRWGGVWTENARWDHSYTEYGSSYLLEGPWYPEPFAQWVLDYYGQGEINRYRW